MERERMDWKQLMNRLYGWKGGKCNKTKKKNNEESIHAKKRKKYFGWYKKEGKQTSEKGPSKTQVSHVWESAVQRIVF